MNFIENIMDLFFNLGEHLSTLFNGFVEFLTLPFALLLSLLQGIFHFINSVFQIIILSVSIFVALFQFFFSIVGALMRTVGNMVGFAPSGSVNMNYATQLGFETALEQIGGTGLLTVVPNVLIAVIWLLFAYKVIGLLGDDKGKVKT